MSENVNNIIEDFETNDTSNSEEINVEEMTETKNELMVINIETNKKSNLTIYLIIGIPIISVIFISSLLLFLLFFPISIFFSDSRYFVTYTDPIQLSELVEIEGYENPTNTLYATAFVEDNTFSTVEYFYKKNHKEDYTMVIPYEDDDIIYIENYDEYLDNETNRSVNNATYLAYCLQGYEFPIKNQGALVTYIPSEYESISSKKSLKTGDYILSVDGKVVRNIKEVNEVLSKLSLITEKVDIEVIRDNSYLKISHPLVKKEKELDLSVGLEDYKDAFLPSDAYVDTSLLQGPSAGLMFSLQMISILYGEDLTGGYKVAGTGTIDKEGNVGQIGGIEYKLKGAMLNDVDVFFVPSDINPEDDNYKKAQEFLKENQTDMKIVPVETVYDAINYLFTISGKKK